MFVMIIAAAADDMEKLNELLIGLAAADMQAQEGRIEVRCLIARGRG